MGIDEDGDGDDDDGDGDGGGGGGGGVVAFVPWKHSERECF